MVSGYSKTKTDESLISNIAQTLDPYKKFKKMYVVDSTGELKGNFVNIKDIVNYYLKILTLN